MNHVGDSATDYDADTKSRVWCETVVTKNLIWKPWFRGHFDYLVNNANLGAIAQNEQWHLNFHCLLRVLVTTVSRQALEKQGDNIKPRNYNSLKTVPVLRSDLYAANISRMHLFLTNQMI